MEKRRIDTGVDRGGTGEAKKSRQLPHGPQALPSFYKWCEKQGMIISDKVAISDSCIHRFGMVAAKPIETSEVLFEIPRSMLLWEDNSTSKGSIPGLSDLKSKSGWVKLLLVLMLEYTNPNSKWKEYMQFAPSQEVMDTPIYWDPEVRKKLLTDTPLLSLVEKDTENIKNEYKSIALPFILNNPAAGFDKDKYTLDLYMHMAGFVMAYSFTEPGDDSEVDSPPNPPKMVPMADVLNHISKHNAHLQFEENSLKMVATRDITQGSEVFNTFGYLSNSQLLQMYGFVEECDSNAHDSVDIPLEYFRNNPNISLIEEKWEYLFGDDGVLEGCDSITIGTKGILSSDETKVILKILSMTPSEFGSYDGEEWESDSSNSSGGSDSVYVLTHRKITAFPSLWKKLLRNAGQNMHTKLCHVLQEKKELAFSDLQNQKRKEKVMTILENQVLILNNLINACSAT